MINIGASLQGAENTEEKNWIPPPRYIYVTSRFTNHIALTHTISFASPLSPFCPVRQSEIIDSHFMDECPESQRS